MSFKEDLDEFIDEVSKIRVDIKHAVIAVTEQTCRRRLGIRKPEPLIYRRFALTCIDSVRWRNMQYEERVG